MCKKRRKGFPFETRTRFFANKPPALCVTYIALLLIAAAIATWSKTTQAQLPAVINTWDFLNANQKAWKQLTANKTAIDAIEVGCNQCEVEQCDGTVGWGGSPAETGETTLDAMIMDGETYNVGGVGGLRRIKSAVSVARAVLERTNHTLLVGEMATQFAAELGFKLESLESDESRKMNQEWKRNSCQPNFWINVIPDPRKSCGPYRLAKIDEQSLVSGSKSENNYVTDDNHDTIGMVAIDSRGRIASGTSTNGLRNKILGRVGDSPIPGAGSYAAGGVGGAAATGDGDTILRHLLSFQAVELLRQGFSAQQAAHQVMKNLKDRLKGEKIRLAGLVVMSINGDYGASCYGLQLKQFPYAISNSQKQVQKELVDCLI